MRIVGLDLVVAVALTGHVARDIASLVLLDNMILILQAIAVPMGQPGMGEYANAQAVVCLIIMVIALVIRMLIVQPDLVVAMECVVQDIALLAVRCHTILQYNAV